MQRHHETLTGRGERALIQFLCEHMPNWVTSDLLTAVGLFGAVLTCVGYWLGEFELAYLWIAILGLAINWFGDSLDGSLARFRKAERPQYGFFLDHTIDGYAMAFVALGFGLSPLAHFMTTLFVLVAYYLVVILSLTTCLATGVFRISFGRLGPTEIRLGIVALTLGGIFLPIARFEAFGAVLSIYDLLVGLLAIGLVLTAMIHTRRTLRQLAKIDPPKFSGEDFRM